MRSRTMAAFAVGLRPTFSFTSINSVSPFVSPSPVTNSLARHPSAAVHGSPKPAGFSTSSEILRDVGRANSVQRDLSPLADETRTAVEATMKTMYGLSNALAFLGVSQLGVGAWAYHAIPASLSSPLVAAMGCMSVGFPLCLSCILRRQLRAMFFLKRMEEEGRLHILSMNLRVAKNMDRFFVRLRPVSCAFVGGGFLLAGLCSKATLTP